MTEFIKVFVQSASFDGASRIPTTPPPYPIVSPASHLWVPTAGAAMADGQERINVLKDGIGQVNYRSLGGAWQPGFGADKVICSDFQSWSLYCN